MNQFVLRRFRAARMTIGDPRAVPLSLPVEEAESIYRRELGRHQVSEPAVFDGGETTALDPDRDETDGLVVGADHQRVDREDAVGYRSRLSVGDFEVELRRAPEGGPHQ